MHRDFVLFVTVDFYLCWRAILAYRNILYINNLIYYISPKDAVLVLFKEEKVSGSFLFGVFQGIHFVNPRPVVVGISSEGNIEHVQELVHTSKK